MSMVSAILVGSSVLFAPGGDVPSTGERWGTAVQGSQIVVEGYRRSAGARPVTQGRDQSTPTYVYRRLPNLGCVLIGSGATAGSFCGGEPDRQADAACEDGSTPQGALWRAEVDPVTGEPGQWVQVDAGGCPEEAQPAVVLTAQDFQRLPLTASSPRTQPVDGRGLVGMDLIVFTDPQPQTLTTTVLGQPVTVRATPVRFSWDFGDGSAPLVTEDPGRPYPDHTVARPYSSTGEYAVTLTTTWAGEYQVGGAGPWLPVAGTATTTSAPFTAVVESAPSRLVDQR